MQVGADDVDDERLRHQRLDEPAGLEQSRRVGLVRVGYRGIACGQFRRGHQSEVVALEDEPHHGVGGVVEDRADRADEEDEPAISPMFQGRGLAICSGPTLSVGMGTCEKS